MSRIFVFAFAAVLACTSLLSAQEAKGRKVALLVGINDYGKSGLGKLKCAEKDATDLRDLLVTKLGYQKRDVYLMTKAEGYETKNDSLFPTGDNIRANLKGLVEDLKKADSVLIAFSGHGVHLKALKEKGLHFCPSDANLDKPETLVSISEIFGQLKDHCKADLKLLVMDACRNDPSDGRAASETKLQSVTRPLIPKPEGGTVAFFSCSEGQKAFENEKVGRGFFMDSLIRGLAGEAANKMGEVTIPLLEEFLQTDVSATVKREKGLTARQVPERLGDLRGRVLLARFPSASEPKDPESPEEREFEIAKGVKMKFCWIPAGKATLGSPDDEKDRDGNEKVHEFATKGFWLGKFEVTQEQWKAVMGSDPSKFKGAKLPVDSVSWDDCQKFLTKCEVKNLKVKLPHEDEWEYACRGGLGNKRPFYWGAKLTNEANNNDKETTVVGSFESKAKHPWGLCDISGNVAEWCDNVISEGNTNRVLRGGSWFSETFFCRSACRAGFKPDFHNDNFGFRVCLSPD